MLSSRYLILIQQQFTGPLNCSGDLYVKTRSLGEIGLNLVEKLFSDVYVSLYFMDLTHVEIQS